MSSRSTVESARHRTAPAPFHVMVKPRGPVCNLDCSYCYYLSKERLYPGSRFRMADELLESYIREYIEAQRVPEVSFAWQGGEPTLMGLDFFERVVELQYRYRRPGMRIHNALQTNGTLLDDAWCRFFKRHEFLVGLSIDGPQPLHDAYRVDKGGRGTFARVVDGFKLLQRHAVDVNVLTTLHAANADRPLEVYRFLRDDLGARHVQFIPIVEREDGWKRRVTRRSITGAQYGAFLIGVFDEWVRHDVGTVFVQIFDIALGAWLGHEPSLCVFRETCGDAVVMEHNGDVYSCDHFVTPEHLLGNIEDLPLVDMVASERQRRFGDAKRDSLPSECDTCAVRFVCNGGCPKNRFVGAFDGAGGSNYLCEGYKAFFTHIDGPMRRMAAEVLAGRSPANAMDRAGTPGRNAPCPCGSGAKFKHCHGRQGVERLGARRPRHRDGG